MSLLTDLRADRDALFLDPQDLAQPVICTLPDQATTVALTGVWSERVASDERGDHDRTHERSATLRCAVEVLPSGEPDSDTDLWRCWFALASAPAELFAVRGVAKPANGLAKLALHRVELIERNARKDLVQVQP